MLEYRVTDVDGSVRVYRGLNAARSGMFAPGRLVVLAWFEGDYEAWVVDGSVGILELRRYYDTEWPGHPVEFTVAEVK